MVCRPLEDENLKITIRLFWKICIQNNCLAVTKILFKGFFLTIVTSTTVFQDHSSFAWIAAALKLTLVSLLSFLTWYKTVLCEWTHLQIFRVGIVYSVENFVWIHSMFENKVNYAGSRSFYCVWQANWKRLSKSKQKMQLERLGNPFQHHQQESVNIKSIHREHVISSQAKPSTFGTRVIRASKVYAIVPIKGAQQKRSWTRVTMI